jgi:hypothetical protein
MAHILVASQIEGQRRFGRWPLTIMYQVIFGRCGLVSYLDRIAEVIVHFAIFAFFLAERVLGDSRNICSQSHQLLDLIISNCNWGTFRAIAVQHLHYIIFSSLRYEPVTVIVKFERDIFRNSVAL